VRIIELRSTANHLQVPETPSGVRTIKPGQTNLFDDTKAFPRLHWNCSDTDLLELVTALYETGAVKASEGKITKRQLQLGLEWLFNHPVKGAGSKLTKARDRKMEPARFLTELKEAFVVYSNKS